MYPVIPHLQNTPAVTILESTEQLARSGFTNQNRSYVPPVTVNQTVDQEEIVQENISEKFYPLLLFLLVHTFGRWVVLVAP